MGRTTVRESLSSDGTVNTPPDQSRERMKGVNNKHTQTHTHTPLQPPMSLLLYVPKVSEVIHYPLKMNHQVIELHQNLFQTNLFFNFLQTFVSLKKNLLNKFLIPTDLSFFESCGLLFECLFVVVSGRMTIVGGGSEGLP